MSRENRFDGTIDFDKRPDFDGEPNLEAIHEEFVKLELDQVMEFEWDGSWIAFHSGTVFSNRPFNASNFQLAESLAYLAVIAWENGYEMASLDSGSGVTARNEFGMMHFTVANSKVWVDKISFGYQDKILDWTSGIEVKVTRRLGQLVDL